MTDLFVSPESIMCSFGVYSLLQPELEEVAFDAVGWMPLGHVLHFLFLMLTHCGDFVLGICISKV